MFKTHPGFDKRLELLGPLMSPALDGLEDQPDLDRRFAAAIGGRK